MMKLTADDLKEFGIIDRVISEPLGGVQKNIDSVCEELRKEIPAEFVRLFKMNESQRTQSRYDKYRQMGRFKD